jgi:hypothetical protein
LTRNDLELLQLPMGAKNRILAFQTCFVGQDSQNRDYKLFMEGKATLSEVTRAMLIAAKSVCRENMG